MSGHKCVWAQTYTFVLRHDCDHTTITCQGTNVSGHKRVVFSVFMTSRIVSEFKTIYTFISLYIIIRGLTLHIICVKFSRFLLRLIFYAKFIIKEIISHSLLFPFDGFEILFYMHLAKQSLNYESLLQLYRLVVIRINVWWGTILKGNA